MNTKISYKFKENKPLVNTDNKMYALLVKDGPILNGVYVDDEGYVRFFDPEIKGEDEYIVTREEYSLLEKPLYDHGFYLVRLNVVREIENMVGPLNNLDKVMKFITEVNGVYH